MKRMQLNNKIRKNARCAPIIKGVGRLTQEIHIG